MAKHNQSVKYAEESIRHSGTLNGRKVEIEVLTEHYYISPQNGLHSLKTLCLGISFTLHLASCVSAHTNDSNIPFGVSTCSVALTTSATLAFGGPTWELFQECAARRSTSPKSATGEPGITISSVLNRILHTGLLSYVSLTSCAKGYFNS